MTGAPRRVISSLVAWERLDTPDVETGGGPE